jgi:hypothetical protein
MKRLIFGLLIVITLTPLLTSCHSLPSFLTDSNGTPSIFKLIALALLAIYEVIVRIIPTIADYSPISWIIRFLKWISDGLNNGVR